ncbi:MAG: MgtC/SapB family protein [Thermoanaerobaculia bacterium]
MSDGAQTLLLQLAVAALAGFAVGVEREWSAGREKPNTRFGGVRTFLLLGLIGGISAILTRDVDPRIGAVLLGGALLSVAIAYFVSAWQGTIDATTEVAAIVVLGAGALAGWGLFVPASAIAALTALVLVSKGPLHGAVAKLRPREIEAAARFAALALVLLPLLPKGPLAGLGGIEPQKLWGLVLVFAGLSFAGYVAMRLAGPERGYGIAGLLGGIVSSTAVTLHFSRESRRMEKARLGLALGVVAASTVLPLRVGVLSWVLQRDVGRALLPALVLPLFAGAVFVGAAIWRSTRGGEEIEAQLPASPLRLGSAIQMVVLFQVVLWVLGAVRERLGESGIVGGAALVGLTDLDALTFSTTELAKGGLDPTIAARALLVGMIANTTFKGALVAALGASGFRLRVLTALALFAGLFALGLLWV